MRILFLLSCGAALAFSQARPAATPLPEDKILATAAGESITVARLREILVGAPAVALTAASQDPEQFLVSHFMNQRLISKASEIGLDKKSPHAERIEWARLQVLSRAVIREQRHSLGVKEEDAAALYADRKHQYGTAQVRMIFVAGSNAKAKLKATSLLKQAQAGGDFAQLAAKNSEDPATASDGGLLPAVVAQSKLPDVVKKAIFATAAGGVTLVPFEGSFYLFKVESVNLRPFDEVKQEVLDQMIRAKYDDWMKTVRQTTEAKIVHEEFFKNLSRRAGPSAQNYIPPAKDGEISEDTVLATINGRNMTAADFNRLMKGVSPQVRGNAIRSPLPFLEQYALLSRLAEEAVKRGLDKQQPYKNEQVYMLENVLSQAVADDQLNRITIGAEEPRKAYDADPSRFRFTNVRVIYVSFSLTPPPSTNPNAPKVLTEPEAKQKADEIVAKGRSGTDFVAMVELHSEDQQTKKRGGQIEVYATDQKVPEPIRKLIFATPEGEVTEPIRHGSGYYLFKIESRTTKPFDAVKDQIFEELRQAEWQKWFTGLRNSIQVRIEDAGAFKQVAEQAAAAARQG
jgi:parvulin-like peptidyl-prolyl isomerase